MTHPGLLAGAALDGLALQADDTVVYASTYAETRALEDYLASFPAASPLLFQASIHPSALQQVMIGRQQPIRSFWPMSGPRLVETALLAALIDPAPRVALVGAEERGTWLLEHRMAGGRPFGFAVLLVSEPAGAGGRISFQPAEDAADDPVPTLEAFADALAERRRPWLARGRRPVVAHLVMSAPAQLSRNPGPLWGFAFLQKAERWIPWPIFRILVGAGAAIAMAVMTDQRNCSREYLTAALGRPPRLTEIWGHFYAFARFLLIKLRVARGVPHRGRMDPTRDGNFEAFMAREEPAFFGTFHFGQSDLLGYLLGSRFRRQVFMVRLQMGNATDTRLLGRLFGRWVSFIWVNRPEDLLFALKDAVASGGSLALQCDRLEFTAKTEPFHFLGGRRMFPFTIYHLAVLFGRPVVFCTGIPGASRDETVLQASVAFRPDPALSRAANLQRARARVLGVLTHVEGLVRQSPALWFNFLPLNPLAPPAEGAMPNA